MEDQRIIDIIEVLDNLPKGEVDLETLVLALEKIAEIVSFSKL